MRPLLLIAVLLATLAAPAAAQWDRIDTGYPLTDVFATNLLTFDGAFLYATVLTNPPARLHMLRSADDGTTWTEQMGFPDDLGGGANFFTDLDGRLALGGLTPDASAARFLFSDDQGVTWDDVLAPGVGDPNAMARRGALYLAGTANVVARSTDGGQTWANVDGSPTGVGALAITSNRVVATGLGGFLYESVDDGLTWSALTVGGNPIATALWQEGTTTYVKMNAASLYASTDGGATWDEQPTFDPFTFVFVAPGPEGDDTLVIHGGRAPSLSTDQGATAADLSAGYPTDITSAPCTSNFAMTDDFVIANAWGCFNDNTGVYRQGYTPTTSVEQSPERFTLRLDAPYPNPTRTEAAVRFTMETSGPARLAVYDALGREVAVLHEGLLPAGTQTRPFEAGVLPAGIYVVRLMSGGHTAARTFTVTR